MHPFFIRALNFRKYSSVVPSDTAHIFCSLITIGVRALSDLGGGRGGGGGGGDFLARMRDC